MNIIYLGFIAAVGIIALASLNWRTSVKSALVLIILEGALRKWVFPQGSFLIYFLKDFVLLGAYLGYFFVAREQIRLVVKDNTIAVLAAMASFWCVFQAFNPSLGSPIIGFFGVKNYLIYIPLLWILPALFSSIEDLYQFLRYYLLLIIPVGLLAILQFFSPTDSILNVYADDSHQVAVFGFGGRLIAARVTATFSYIAGYSSYLAASFALLLPMISLPQPRLWKWLTMAEFMIVTITCFMTGARALIGSLVIITFFYFAIQAWTHFQEFVDTLQKFTLPALVALAGVMIGFRSAVEAFWTRVTNNQDIASRLSGGSVESFSFFNFKGVDGYGTGATFQANPVIRALFGLPSGEHIPTYYEAEMGRVALELGPIGFYLWYGFKIVVLVALGMVYFRLQRTFLRQLALSAFLLQVMSFTGQLVFNHTAGLYHWFFNSFIFLLPQLEQAANWHQYQQKLQIYAHTTQDIPDSPN